MVHLAGADMLESREPKRQLGSLRGRTLNSHGTNLVAIHCYHKVFRE